MRRIPLPAPASSSAEAVQRPTSAILKNVTSNWAGILVGIVLSFLLGPITVNSLGNVYYGIWTLLMQFTGYLWLFDFGVRESVVKYVAQHHAADEHEELESTVNTAISLYGCVALVALAAVSVLAYALPYVFNIPAEAVWAARVAAFLAGVTIAQGFIFNVFVGVLMGLQKFHLISRLGIFFSIGRAAVVFALLSAGYGIIALAIVQFALSLGFNLLVYRMCRVHLPYLSIRFVKPQRAAAVRLLNYGKYVLISNVGDKLVFATDALVIGMFMPVSALTYFAIGGSLIEYLRSFITQLGMMLNPLSSSLEARNETHRIATVLLTGSRASVLLGLPVCIVFIVLGERFISLWMGESYATPAGVVLTALASGLLVGLPYYSISGVLYGLGRHRVIALSRIFEGVANLGLSVLLIKQYGLLGVALGTVIPHVIVVAGVLPSVVSKLLRVGLREYYVSVYVLPFLASVPFWITCWLIAKVMKPANLFTFFGSIAVGLIAYAIPCWFIALSPADRELLRGPLRRRLQPHTA